MPRMTNDELVAAVLEFVDELLERTGNYVQLATESEEWMPQDAVAEGLVLATRAERLLTDAWLDAGKDRRKLETVSVYRKAAA